MATIDPSLFRFVSVRPPQRLVKPRPDVVLIKHELSTRAAPVTDAAAVAVIVESAPLYEWLVRIRAANGTREEMEKAVRNFRATKEWIRSAADLQRSTRFYEDFRRLPGAASDPALRKMLEAAFDIRLETYVSSGTAAAQRRMLFNNLFSAIIIPDDPPLREDILIALKVEQLIKDVHLRDVEGGAQPVGESLPPIPTRGIVMLPRTIFPLPAPAAVVSAPILPPEGHTHDADARAQDVRTLQAALDEVDRAIAGEGLQLASALETIASVRGAPSPVPLREARSLLATRLVSAMSSAAHDHAVDPQFAVGGRFISTEDVCVPSMPNLCAPYPGGPLPLVPGKPHSMAVGDLLVVRQTLQSYLAGEVSHITNVMATETREARHRHLLRTEETLTVERETTTEKLRDLQSTERFSLENETKQVIREASALEAGVTLSGSNGVVNISASASYSTMSAKETATDVATGYAKEVTDRALERVTERVREQRSRTTIEEIEETNLHRFENTSETHVVGIYQWVDKVYLSELFNLGRRLMLTFNVPEPAAFFLHCAALLETAGGSLERPIPPDEAGPLGRLSSAADLTESNYMAFAARYGATGIEPPPPLNVTSSAAYSSPNPPAGDQVVAGLIDIPDGYVAKKARLRSGWSVGTARFLRTFVGGAQADFSGDADIPLDDETGSVPVSLQSSQTYFVANIEITCELTKEALDKWRLATYTAIITAYESRKAEYERKALSQVTARSFSPARNSEIEREELKRGCLQLLTGQRFDAFSAMQINQSQGYPEFSEARAELEGPYIEFFERALDWSNMTYLFRPYFWARKPNWVSMRQYETDDPLFTRFLQAGAAQVVVAAQPAYARAILYFLESGEVWNGDDAPVVEDDLHLSIVHELIEAESLQVDPAPLSSWQVKVPTTLTLLKTVDPGMLPDWSNL